MARLKGFRKLVRVDEALRIFMEKLRLQRLEAEEIPLQEAMGRVTAEDIIAEADLPPFNRSAVDGYAVKAEDTFEASPFNPKFLKITSEEVVGKGKAITIWTGDPLPDGADAVVMLEHTRRVNGGIEVLTSVTPGENVSRRGEDVRRGEVVVNAGTRLKFHHVGLLAALGLTRVKVVRKPRVAILATGSELVELGETPKSTQIINANYPILSCMCLELGANPINLGIARDDLNEISAKLREGIKRADLVITTGGTSVGEDDLVPLAINQTGTPGVVVHGIAMRPGMPTGLAILESKPLVMLSGNPVAAIIGFEVFVRPILLGLMGIEGESRPVIRARLTRRVAAVLGRRVFLRVRVFEENGNFLAEPIRITGSGILTTMTKANGYVIIPEDRGGLEEGEWIRVHLFDAIDREKR